MRNAGYILMKVKTVKLTVKLYGENSTLKVFGCRTLH